MAIPETYTTYRRTSGPLPLTIVQSTVTTPKSLGANDVLLKIHSVALNYRDAAMLHGAYPGPVKDNGIPASDAAAEVVAVGSAVQKFKVGDHVSPNFSVNYLTGEETEPAQGLGGEVEGVLGEYAVFAEDLLVRLPDYLSWDEVSEASICYKFSILLLGCKYLMRVKWLTAPIGLAIGIYGCLRRRYRMVCSWWTEEAVARAQLRSLGR